MKALTFLTNTRGRRSLHWTDWLSYAYLAIGLFLICLLYTSPSPRD